MAGRPMTTMSATTTAARMIVNRQPRTGQAPRKPIAARVSRATAASSHGMAPDA